MKRSKAVQFKTFASSFVGLPVSHVWRGHGSALLVEFGRLGSTTKRDGSAGHPSGETGLMIEWDWRIERPRSILCGSNSDSRRWPRAFSRLLGAEVVDVYQFGRLAEIGVHLSNGLHVVSLMTAEGRTAWTLFDRRSGEEIWLDDRGIGRGGRP